MHTAVMRMEQIDDFVEVVHLLREELVCLQIDFEELGVYLID